MFNFSSYYPEPKWLLCCPIILFLTFVQPCIYFSQCRHGITIYYGKRVTDIFGFIDSALLTFRIIIHCRYLAFGILFCSNGRFLVVFVKSACDNFLIHETVYFIIIFNQGELSLSDVCYVFRIIQCKKRRFYLLISMLKIVENYLDQNIRSLFLDYLSNDKNKVCCETFCILFIIYRINS